VYGILYGQGAAALSRKLEISQAEAAQLTSVFYKSFPATER
jgi:DNA polymerase I-like protein with 3'-5' exonuclease and polymerase domains